MKRISVFAAALLLLCGCAQASPRQSTVMYGVVTDISGDAYTLALGSLNASAAQADSADESDADSGLAVAAENADSAMLTPLGITTTLHISADAEVNMRLGDSEIRCDLSRVAVGHIVKLTVIQNAKLPTEVLSVEIIG